MQCSNARRQWSGLGLKYGDWVNRMKRKSLAPKGGTWRAGCAKGSGAWHLHGAPRRRAAAAKLQTVKCPGAELAFPRCFGDESEPGAKDLLSPALFFSMAWLQTRLQESIRLLTFAGEAGGRVPTLLLRVLLHVPELLCPHHTH